MVISILNSSHWMSASRFTWIMGDDSDFRSWIFPSPQIVAFRVDWNNVLGLKVLCYAPVIRPPSPLSNPNPPRHGREKAGTITSYSPACVSLGGGVNSHFHFFVAWFSAGWKSSYSSPQISFINQISWSPVLKFDNWSVFIGKPMGNVDVSFQNGIVDLLAQISCYLLRVFLPCAGYTCDQSQLTWIFVHIVQGHLIQLLFPGSVVHS